MKEDFFFDKFKFSVPLPIPINKRVTIISTQIIVPAGNRAALTNKIDMKSLASMTNVHLGSDRVPPQSIEPGLDPVSKLNNMIVPLDIDVNEGEKISLNGKFLSRFISPDSRSLL